MKVTNMTKVHRNDIAKAETCVSIKMIKIVCFKKNVNKSFLIFDIADELTS